jgi:hypothetical protein
MSLFRRGNHGDRGSDDLVAQVIQGAMHAPKATKEPVAMQDPVPGRALVVAINSWLEWPRSGLAQIEYMYSGPLTATLVVEADGVPKTTVEHSERVAQGDPVIIPRWPAQGDTVPVLVDRADPSRVRFQWDQMPSTRDRLARMEQARAQELLEEAYRQPPQGPEPRLR